MGTYDQEPDLSEVVEVEKKQKRKPEIARDKHRKQLAGTPFVRCADCPGTCGVVESDGRMRCSNVGARPVFITAEQAKRCDGTKPPPYNNQEKHNHKPHAIFRRPEHRV